MKRNFRLFIDDILENIKLIENSTEDLSKSQFRLNRDIFDAVIRRLELIGEAVKNLPTILTDKYPEVPWKDISGFRDVLIHTYFGINFERIWNIIKIDVPVLKKQILKIKISLKNKK